MRPAVVVVASVVVIAAAYLADRALAEAISQGRASFRVADPIALAGLARLVLVGALAALGWFGLRAPRSRIAGFTMAIIGLYFALAPLYPALLANTGIPLPPMSWEALGSSTGFTLWASAAVAVIGLMAVLRPARSTTAGA